MLPDLESLRLLTDIARLGSIGAAGRAAGMTQQSASERLRALEATAGLDLVTRSPGGSALTPSGLLLVEWSADLLARAAEVETALHTLRQGRARRVRVYASMTVAESLLPRVLVRLRREREINVRLHATNSEAVITAVRAGRADVGFVEGPIDLRGLGSMVVGVDELVLVAAPDDAWSRRRTPLDAAAIARRPLTSREQGSGTRTVWERALESAGAEPAPPESELETTAALLSSVAAGGPPAFVSRRAAARDLEMGDLVELKTTGIDLHRVFTAVWLGGRRPAEGPVRDILGLIGAGAAGRS